MKKVLFVATVSSHIKTFHLPFIKILKKSRIQTYVAAKWNLIDKQNLEDVDKFFDIAIKRQPFSFYNFMAIKQLKEIIKKEKFNTIHCHTPMGGVVARMAAKSARKKYGTKVIYTAHGFHFYKGAPLLNWLLFFPVEWFLAKHTDVLITINSEDYKTAKKFFAKRCHQIEKINGVGVDEKKYDSAISPSKRNKILKSLGLSQKDFIMIFPARLDKNKNQGFLIDVMEDLVSRHKNIHLLLPGRDELNGYYQKIVHKKKLDRNIHFLGYRNDVFELQKVSNIVVSSSLREGLPVNIIEALFAHKPAVVLNCRGMSDLIENGVNGQLIEIKDQFKKQKFLDAIMDYHDGKKWRSPNLIKEEKFYIEKISKQVLSFYQKV